MRGPLTKMSTEIDQASEQLVHYTLTLDNSRVALNPLLGRRLRLHWTGQIFCTACGRKTSKSFAQGHCYPCMTTLASCDLCVLKPETCHYAAGTCREPQWAEQYCMTAHIVYLANTSGLKVGITRASQIPTRWLDQGATQARPLLHAATRHVAGLLEVALARTHADKTNWRALLKSEGAPLDLAAAADAARSAIADDIASIAERHGVDAVRPLDGNTLTIRYPVRSYPLRVASHNFDKHPVVEGVLEGIKGQYLLFDTGVINLRKFTGYDIELDV